MESGKKIRRTSTYKVTVIGLSLLIAILCTYSGLEVSKYYQTGLPVYNVGDCFSDGSLLTVQIRRIDSKSYYYQGIAVVFPFVSQTSIREFHKIIDDSGMELVDCDGETSND